MLSSVFIVFMYVLTVGLSTLHDIVITMHDRDNNMYFTSVH